MKAYTHGKFTQNSKKTTHTKYEIARNALKILYPQLSLKLKWMSLCIGKTSEIAI